MNSFYSVGYFETWVLKELPASCKAKLPMKSIGHEFVQITKDSYCHTMKAGPLKGKLFAQKIFGFFFKADVTASKYHLLQSLSNCCAPL